MSALIERYVFREDCCATNYLGEGAERKAIVTGPCYSCTAPQMVTVDAADLERFQAGGFAQDCFPRLSAGQREFLISGICDECWDQLFPEE